MLKLKNNSIVIILWLIVAVLGLIVVMPSTIQPHQSKPKPGLPGDHVVKDVPQSSVQFDNHPIINPENLAIRIFGNTAYVTPVGNVQIIAVPKPPANLPTNANIKYLGIISVEGVRKIVFSDTVNQVSFAISKGERYAGWTCIRIGTTEAILSRDGIEYRVPIQNQ